MPSRLTILDADVVIVCHQLGLWNRILNQYQVHLPSTVLHEEVQFFRSARGKEEIDLGALVTAGLITELAGSALDIADLTQRLDPEFLKSIHAGELEALALLHSQRYPDHRMCTGDRRAMIALSVLDLGSQGVSLEKLLSESGHGVRMPRPNFTERFFRDQMAQGLMERNSVLRA